MLSSTTNMIPHTKATELASQFQSATAQIQSLVLQLGEQVERLNKAFQFEAATYGAFDVKIEYQHSHSVKMDAEGVDKLQQHFLQAAWRILVEKLQIMKLMSSKRRDALSDQLRGERGSAPLPSIDENSIMDVLRGFIADAPNYLEESIRESYDWLIPRSHHGKGQYVTNKRDRVGEKVILQWIGDVWQGKLSGVNYHAFGNITALDSVFHSLDGKGFAGGHNGPLLDTMRATIGAGTGDTDYFRFKLFKNGNCHLEFKRRDLLDLFNQVAADGRSLGDAKRAA